MTEPFGWYLEPVGHYAPVFRKGAEPPEPLTREEAMEKGWRPLHDRASAAPAEPVVALVEAATAAVEAAYRMASDVKIGNLMPEMSRLHTALARYQEARS